MNAVEATALVGREVGFLVGGRVGRAASGPVVRAADGWVVVRVAAVERPRTDNHLVGAEVAVPAESVAVM